MKFKRIVNEKLIYGKSQRAFDNNVRTEMETGKPQKQAVAIAYSIRDKALEKEKKNKRVKEAMEREYILYVSREDNKDRYYMNESDEDLEELIKYANEFILSEIKDKELHFAYIMDNEKNIVWDSEKGKIKKADLDETLQGTQNDIFKKALDIKEICFSRLRELGKTHNNEEAEYYQEILKIANDIKILSKDIDENNELNESAFRIGDKLVKNTEDKPSTISSVVGVNIVYKDDNDEVVMYNLDKDVDEELFGKIVNYLAQPQEESFEEDNLKECIDIDNFDEDNVQDNNVVNQGYSIQQIQQHAQSHMVNTSFINTFEQNPMMPNSPLGTNSVGTTSLINQPIQFWDNQQNNTPLGQINTQNQVNNGEIQNQNVIDEYVTDNMARDDEF